ncbi:beta-ketoacyl [acyl carrier protein] synthase domain-containing protein [Streptomyces sp. WG-D5]
MDQREILARFKSGQLDRGRAVHLLTGVPTGLPDAGAYEGGGAESGAEAESASREDESGVGRSAVDAGVGVDRYAVIGLAGRYPLAPDLPTYWANLRDGRDTATAVPAPRPTPSPLPAGGHGHFLSAVDAFDPEFFQLRPEKAAVTDPQQRLFLEAGWQALEDAGLTGARLDTLLGPGGQPRSVGVFAGVSACDYALLAAGSRGRGGGQWDLAGRLGRLLGLTGPAQVVDAAEASGLVAVHLAVAALRAGECAVAVAGAAELLLHPARARDGAGEGVGAVVLKPLVRALADGDPVHAVVRDTGACVAADEPVEGLYENRESTLRRVGDAGAATGIAAFTAAVLQLRHATRAPLRPDGQAEPWPGPRVATVEIRIPDGPAARAVLESFTPSGSATPDAEDGAAQLVLLSAPTPAHLRATAERFADWLAGAEGARVALGELAAATRATRSALPCRLALRPTSRQQLRQQLAEFVAEEVAPPGGTGDALGLGAAPETQDYLRALWRGGRVEQLTRLWLAGLDIDWPALERRPPHSPVDLPHTAFLRRSLWYDGAPG